jgi:hypothetical protein
MSPRTTEIAVFVGPTGRYSESANGNGITLLPLAGPGDLEKKIKTQPEPGIVAIVDGSFYQRPALSHEEIRLALRAGWQVWGLSAFGAIRAYELRHLGMIGFGEVFEGFCRGQIATDDEVLFLHSEAGPYYPASEPLVNFREALRQMVLQNAIAQESAAGILKTLSKHWFGDRTLNLFGRLLTDDGGLTNDVVDSILVDFDRFRVGVNDLQNFLFAKPWIDQNAT